mgnify:CR=1 FL=1
MEDKQRIIQELVPGRQITLAHIIANPDSILYEKLGLNPAVEYAKSAIGVLTVSPAETAIIIADIAMKSSGVDLGFVDRFSGSVIVTGTVSEQYRRFSFIRRKHWATPSARLHEHEKADFDRTQRSGKDDADAGVKRRNDYLSENTVHQLL